MTAHDFGRLIIALSLAPLVYGYLCFPLLLLLLSKIYPKSTGITSRREFSEPPDVAVIFSFFNESRNTIINRIENILSNGYPLDKLRIIAVADGPPSGFADSLAEFITPTRARVSIVEQGARLGKTSAQNRAVAECDADIVIFTDANTHFSKQSIEKIVHPLALSDTGCAVGKLVYQNPGAENSYWKIENRLKSAESSYYSALGANGAFYALRRADYIPLPAHALSDLCEPLLVLLLKRRGSVFVEEATAKEDTPVGRDSTLARKHRIFIRALQSLPLIVPAMNPFHNPKLAFLFISHKLIRWISAPLIVGLLIGTAVTTKSVMIPSVFLALFAVLVSRACSPVSLAAHAAITLLAQLRAWIDFLLGHRTSIWTPGL